MWNCNKLVTIITIITVKKNYLPMPRNFSYRDYYFCDLFYASLVVRALRYTHCTKKYKEKYNGVITIPLNYYSSIEIIVAYTWKVSYRIINS